MKSFKPISCTTKLLSSVGVMPVWMGNCGTRSNGFTKLRCRNGKGVSPASHKLMTEIRKSDEMMIRLARKMGCCAGDLRRHVRSAEEVFA